MGTDAGEANWQMPIDVALKNQDVVNKVAQAIQDLDPSAIKRIINRIGQQWLPVDRRDLIAKGLLSRRAKITNIVGAT